MKEKISVFWFRRDLRIFDNHGLWQALNAGLQVLPVFIFDTEILGKLNNKNDARVSFIHVQLLKIKDEFEKLGSSIKVFHSKPLEAFRLLAEEFEIGYVFANKDYEPYGVRRDTEIEAYLNRMGIGFYTFKDHVVFAENEILKNDGNPYTVFTPYMTRWKKELADLEIPRFYSELLPERFLKTKPFVLPSLDEIGFKENRLNFPEAQVHDTIISEYANNRDIPSLSGTTRLGIHLRFGTVSIRELTRKALELSEVFLNELIWRNFFIDILWHFPYVETRAFKPKYDLIQWRNNETEFDRWCRGETGFPLVDAGMRELNETGFMHNRVRMVTASFLTKHLLIDWRWGEAWFAEKLLDFELATNNGNWQWAAGSGCDAAPYFRIFNPESQQKKFDPQEKYIRKWVPEYGTAKYAKPVVDHKFARERALHVYRNALK